MKTIAYITVAATMLIATSGISQTNNSSASDDGVYSAPSTNSGGTVQQPMAPADQPQAAPSAPAPQPSTGQQDNYVRNPNQAPQIDTSANKYTGTENYYSDDYSNNYSYSANLRRYDDSYGNWGYYDDVYTNSYWYNYNPYAFGVSIYSPWCYNPFIPYWGYGAGYGFGYGYPYYGGFGWGCGHPYWGWGYGGFGNWGGYHNYYYNSYEGNNNFVGPRGGGVPAPGLGAKISPAVGPGAKGMPATGPGAKIAMHPSTSGFGEMYQGAMHNAAATNGKGYVTSANGTVHVAPAVSGNTMARTSGVMATRPVASYRTNGMNSNINTGAHYNGNAARSNASGNYNRGNNNNVSRSNANSRPAYANNRGYSSPSRIAPSQGSRSNGNYNYHPSSSGSRSYGGGSHSFSGGGAHSSGGGHSFGGGGGGGSHSGGGGFGGGGHSGGGHR